jgi:hypothetical protein
VTLYDNSDNSLLGTLGNGVNNYLLDTPQSLQGPLRILGYHLKTGHTLSVQNRPTGLA